MGWLIKDMHEELAAWGHSGGEKGHIILKSECTSITLNSLRGIECTLYGSI